MTIKYRIKFETYDDADPSIAIKSADVLTGAILKPTNCLDCQ